MIFLHSLPVPVREAVEAGRAVVMGGAIRSHFEGVAPKDVDAFIFDDSVYKELVSSTMAVPLEDTGRCVHKIQGEIPIDLVYAQGFTLDDIHSLGDFDIAIGMYCRGGFSLPENFQAQVGARRMRFLRSSSQSSRTIDI